MNAITLRSGKELGGPQMPMREDEREVDDEGVVEKEVPTKTPSERAYVKKSKEV